MKYKAKFSLTLILQFMICTQGYSQSKEPLSPPEKTNTFNHYRQFSQSLLIPVYRDFATSPLFYNGVGFNSSPGWLKRSNARERLIQFGTGFSAMTAKIPESDFIQPSSEAIFFNINLRYHQLWKLGPLSNEKDNIKVGGTLISSQNFRTNTSLQNNALGLENITNLMASAQITRDISRKEPRQLNLWLFKLTLKPVKRDLRFLFNAGILNLNHRPGYVYSYKSEIVGLETNALSWVLSNYKWSLNGWRFNTEFEYITYLPNGNAHSWAYVWDAAHAPGKHEAFQMASHQFRYTYYFYTKSR